MNTIIKSVLNDSTRKARVISSDKNWLESEAIEQLKKTMTLPGMRIGVGMPDLHPGKGQPIGAAFITEGCIYPHLVGSDIGCGMTLWQLDIPTRKIKLDKWEKQLTDLDDLWQGDTSAWLSERQVCTDDAFLLEEQNKLGTIGGGNHFAEFQQVNEIIDKTLFARLNIDKHAVMLLVHSGSRDLGQKILRQHVDHFGSAAINIKQDAKGFEHYIAQHNYAIQWAEANRELIAERFCQKVKAKKQPLLDVTHNLVKPLSPDEAQLMGLTKNKGHSFWIHRKGASPTNEGLVMIPGSRGSLSYLVKPKLTEADALAEGGFSLAHGAGRKWKRSDARGKLEHSFKAKDLESTKLGSRVICKQRDLLYEEAPQAYKNITQVIEDLAKANMIDIVASFKPLLTYKTRRT